MNQYSINLELLFSADAYYAAGFCPWTFFAYPTNVADEQGLPPDQDACKLLALIQVNGISVSIWQNGMKNNTNYFACKKEDRFKLDELLRTLEADGVIEKNFLYEHSERLFALSISNQATE